MGPFTYALTLSAPPCNLPPPVAFCIPTPGGGQFCMPQLPRFQDPLEQWLVMLRVFGIFMIPLIPVIKVLNALVAIKDFILGLPQNLALLIALNPQPLADSVNRVFLALADVVQLAIPLFAFAAMVKAVLRALQGFLVALRAQIVLMLSVYARVNASLQRAQQLGHAGMLTNAACAKENLDQQWAALIASLGPLGFILSVINVLLCLFLGHGVVTVGLPDLSGGINAALAPLDVAIATLGAVIALLPDGSTGAFSC